MEQYIEKNGIKYELRGEQYYPCFELPEQTQHPIGVWGKRHLEYLKEHRKGTYVGNASGANLRLANNNNVISGKGYVGGIAGIAGVLENCINDGTINSTGVIVENSTSMAYVGGIAGYCMESMSPTIFHKESYALLVNFTRLTGVACSMQI